MKIAILITLFLLAYYTVCHHKAVKVYPNIAIDIKQEYNDDYMRLLWQQKGWE